MKVTLPETNGLSPLKMMVSNRNLLFQGAPIFRGKLAVSFREGNILNLKNHPFLNPENQT